MKENTVLPKGTIVKIDEFPYGLAKDAKVIGKIFESKSDQTKEPNRSNKKKY